MRFWTERTKIMENPAYTIAERIRASRERSLIALLIIGTAGIAIDILAYVVAGYLGLPLLIGTGVAAVVLLLYVVAAFDLGRTHMANKRHLKELQKKKIKERKESEKED